MGFLETLTIVFIVLKLTGVLDWGWLYVFSPIFVAVGMYLVILALYALIYIRTTDKFGP